MEKIIHQIWIGPYKLPHRERGFIDKIKSHQTDFTHMMWDNSNLPELPSEIKHIYDFLGERKDYAHQADILRVFLVEKFGGVYMDVDFEYLGGLSSFNLENYDAFFCTHFGDVDTFPNGIFGASKGHSIMRYLLNDAMKSFPSRYWYGPSWFGNLLKQYFNVTGKISHGEMANEYLTPNNIFHINYDLFHDRYYFHHALYSWSPENRKKFELGKYE